MAEICNAKFEVRLNDKILLSSNYSYIIDINSVRTRQDYPKDIELAFLAATPETITPLLGLGDLIGLGSLKSRLIGTYIYYIKKRIRKTFTLVNPSRIANKLLKIEILDLELLTKNVDSVALAFANKNVNLQFSKFFFLAKKNYNKNILILLPLPRHYGGNLLDHMAMVNYIKRNYDLKNCIILIKNHPSDNEYHTIFEKLLSEFQIHYWHEVYERNLPIELITIPFMERIKLISTGTTAIYTIKASSSIIFWPSDSLARKLARNNYAPSANFLGIKQIFIEKNGDYVE